MFVRIAANSRPYGGDGGGNGGDGGNGTRSQTEERRKRSALPPPLAVDLLREHFPGIHQIVWIQRVLDGAHDVERLAAVFGFEEAPLADADAVFA